MGRELIKVMLLMSNHVHIRDNCESGNFIIKLIIKKNNILANSKFNNNHMINIII